jgi:hypothetical protein
MILPPLVFPGLSITWNSEHLLKGKAQYSWPPHLGNLFCNTKKIMAISKASDLNLLVQAGQLY